MSRPQSGLGSGIRRAGILVPLFSLASSRGWGIGEIGDIDAMTRWLGAARHQVLQLLPINEMPPGETSPYSALSAMAIDLQFITLANMEDFTAIGGEDALEPALREHLDHARRSPHIDYGVVRELKDVALRRCFGHFRERHWEREMPRAAALRACIDDQRWWLGEYALFRALHAEFGETCWTEWPEAIRARQPQALAAARDRLADKILFRQYLQWIAGEQWQAARETAGAVALLGDLQFMVGRDSADVWARQDEFRLDASIGSRRTRSAPQGRTGAFPSIAGRWSPPAGSSSCGTAPAGTPTCTTATASIISSASTAPPTGRSAAARPGSRRRARPTRSPSASASSPHSATRASNSSPRISASSRTSSASPSRVWASPATRCSAGSASGRLPASHSGIRSTIQPFLLRRQGRMTPSRWWSGGKKRRAASARRCSRFHPFAHR